MDLPSFLLLLRLLLLLLLHLLLSDDNKASVRLEVGPAQFNSIGLNLYID